MLCRNDFDTLRGANPEAASGRRSVESCEVARDAGRLALHSLRACGVVHVGISHPSRSMVSTEHLENGASGDHERVTQASDSRRSAATDHERIHYAHEQ